MKTTPSIFDRYEAIRPRLPVMTSGGEMREIHSLMDIANQVEAFVFDAFGVLNVGESMIPGADFRLKALRNAGCGIRVLTNAASYDRSGAIAKFQRLGLELEDHEIITSRDATLTALDARHWGVIAAPEDSFDDLEFSTTRLGDAKDAYDQVEGFVFLSSVDWSDDRQALLEASLDKHARPVIIANADLVAPRDDGFSLEPGFYGHQIADRTNASVRFFGKPFAEVFQLAQVSLGSVAPSKIAMCGDSLHTDILGAAAMGWKSVLVTRDGLFAGYDVGEFSKTSGICADWKLERI